MLIKRRYSRRAIAMLTSGAAIVALALVAVPGMVAANAAGVSQTFAYSSSPQTFTVPAGVTRLDVSLLGGEGGLGGADNTAPLQGGYRGSVSGTLSVTPGEVITIGVGQGGSAGASKLGSAPGGVGGSNPLTGYTGGTGGVAGDQGSSGGGGGGGAATVIQVGTRTVIAGGGGGGGGSGQFAPTAGQPGAADFTARTDVVSTRGQNGISTGAVCTAGIRCDGGASGAGGAGAVGGAPGAVAYGAGTSTEYFGYGGSPGANDASALTAATAVYQYYAVDGANGSVTISYDQSAPGAPTGVSGAVADGATNLSWLAPLSSGGADITDYVVQYALAGASPSWQTFDDGTSAATSAQVTGLTNGTAYQFQVAAVNSFGQSAFSAASTAVTPSAVPGAPTLTSLTGSDSRISVAFTAATSDAAITSYEYQLDGGDWVSTGTSSPFSIGGLTNGTPYSLVLRAVNSVGAGAASGSLSATPVSTPSAPTITAIATGIGSASVSFSASSAGGSPITGYQYQLGSGSWISTGSSSSPFSITGLANGTSYTVALRAISATGSGASSGPSTFATPGAPSAPTISAISVGDGSLDVNFTAGNSGGLAISGYEYQLTSGGVWTAAPTSSSPLVLSGLANGTPYSVRLRAINAIGTGPASAAVSATPVTTPGPPALLAGSVAGGNQQLDASFTAPTSDGGTPITGYEYSTDGGVTWRARATGTTESPLVITTLSGDGTTTLVNGTTYSVEVRAVNAVGAGTSSGVAEGIARTSPDAPSLTTVDSLPKALRVDFASASNGGSPITSYQYRLNGGTWTNTGSMSTEFTIGALADGTSYAVEVRAVNAVGASSASSPLTATPASQPGRASIGAITASDRSLSVSVSVTSTGGSPITAWEYTTDAGASWASLSDTSSPITISNLSSDSSKRLTNGVSYPIEVRAVNAVGTGAASDSTLGIPLTTPSAPTVTLTARNGGIGVNFVAGSSGGSNVTGVEYSIDDATWIPVGSLNNSFAIGSLSNGTLYSVRVRLVNGAGNGDASAAQSATPCTVPDAPTAVAVSPDGSVATVSWSAPAYDGGVAVTDYTATAWSAASGGTAVSSCSTNGETCTIGGLTNGTVYYVSVVATNPAGYGDASSPRVAVVPLAKPSAPAISSITPANTFLTVNFSAGSAGSSAITGYQYSLNSGAWVSVTTTTSPLVISGLTNGVTYSVVLRAVNQSGPGASSTAVVGTPFGVPDVPDSALITATPGNGFTTVNWIAPDNNGSAISSYGVVVWSASFQGTQVTTCATALLTCTLSGLVNGTTYYVTVDATNAAGTTTRSTPRVAVTPGAPGSVAGLAGTASDGAVALWWAPGSSGVGPITDYTIWYAAVGSSSYTQFTDGVSTATAATVTGLSNGTAYRFLVYPINSFGVGQPSSASAAYTPLAAGTTPTLSTAVSADGGFSATITNPEIGTDYSAVSDYGAATVTGDTVTVVGLDDGQSATVTVTATHFGRTTTQASVDGSALLAGTLPVLGAPVRTSDGYTVEISNYSNGVTYTVSATNGATVTIDGSFVTVSGLAPGDSSDVTVVATRAGYTTLSTDATGAALDAGVAPDLSPATSTADGYVVTIGNFSSNYDYSYSATKGSVTGSGGTVTVTGLDPSESSTITVVATRVGYTTTSSDASGVSLDPGADLSTTAVTPTVDGFTFSLVNYDPSFTYSATSTAGDVSFVDGLVTVTGLVPGETASVMLSATKPGAQDTGADVDGAPQVAAGTAPVLSEPVPVTNGFTMTITNYDPLLTYDVTVSSGTVVRTGDLLTITGLGDGEPASVTVTATRAGYTTESGTARGTALDAVPVPTSTPTSTPGPTPGPTSTPHSTPAPTPTSSDSDSTASPSSGGSSSDEDSTPDNSDNAGGSDSPPTSDGVTPGGSTANGGSGKPSTTLITTTGSNSGFGALLGWTIAALLLVIIAVGLFFLLAWRRRRRRDDEEETPYPAHQA